LNHSFENIISVENLLLAWEEFIKGKKNKFDVQEFSFQLMDNILSLHNDLLQRRYKHSEYKRFHICDPKQRVIHKAFVRDRLLHHAIYRIFYPFYDKTFFADSFSCRLNKGTHKAMARFEKFFYKVSQNNTRTCWVLKCDIKKFFDSIDHSVLFSILQNKITDRDTLWLLREIIVSFNRDYIQLGLFDLRDAQIKRERERETAPCGRGIPIGNLTSQLFANIYMNEFDQFVKHQLKIKHYIRYADDFVIVSSSIDYLQDLLPVIESFLSHRLHLKLHPNKISIRKVGQGVDFLGFIILPRYRLVRTKTRQRIFKKLKTRVDEYKAGKIAEEALNQSLQSFLGVFAHANSYELTEKLKNQFWFWLAEI